MAAPITQFTQRHGYVSQRNDQQNVFFTARPTLMPRAMYNITAGL